MRRIVDFASLYQVRTGSHGPSDLSHVCHAAALHFDLWVPNFGVQEYMGYYEQMFEVFPHSRCWVFLSMRNWLRNISMTRRISPSHDWKMAHCGTGNSGSLNYFLNIHQID